jgi:SAM-dependent methyltransferase
MPFKEAIRPCPICRNHSVEILHHQRFVLSEGHILPDAYDVVWCGRCGFAYADTSAPQADYDRYYAEFSKYEDNQTSTGGGGSDWDATRLGETARAIAQVLTDREMRIADIGCANGGLLGELKKLGFQNLIGLDPSPACVAHTRSSHGIEAAIGSLGHLPSEIGQFDLVILSHVLEHVLNLQPAVEKISQLLGKDSLVYVEVPDAARYRDFLVAPFQDFNTEHINHFALAPMRNLFVLRGFQVEQTGAKEIASSPDNCYPAIFGFFRSQGVIESRSYEIDLEFREALISYIAASRKKIATISARLESLSHGRSSILVWGTGQLTMKLLAENALPLDRVAAFVDGNPINQGKTLLGIPILAPNEIADRESPILIATLLHQKEIASRIKDSLKLPNPLILLD